MNRPAHLLFRLLVIAFPFLAAGNRVPKITGIALVAGNLLPLVGVLFFRWSVMEILWIYWAESAIIGVLTVFKMALAISHNDQGRFEALPLLAMIPMGAFFSVHFGGFMAGHAVFLVFMPDIAASMSEGGSSSMGSLIGMENILSLLGCHPPELEQSCTFMHMIRSPIFAGVAALIGSHGVSFYVHFVRGREYYNRKVMELFAAPYGRIIVMHLTIILGAFALVGFSHLFPGQTITTLAGVWVALKIIVDLHAHQNAHANHLSEAQPAANQETKRSSEKE